MGKRCHRFVFPFLLVMILSAGCSQSTPSAPPTTEPTFTEEAIPMADDVDSVQDALPADDSGAPAVYSSVTLEGALTVASHRHEEGDNLCNPFPPGASGCIETYNPCPDAGGGGGGEGDVACLKMPDYCYSCMPDYGATYFFFLLDPERMYISPSTTRFNIDVDPEGYVIRFEWGNSFGGEKPVQTELTSEPGGFHTRWDLFNPNITGKSPGYIIVDGSGISFTVTEYKISDDLSDYQVTDLKGSGTWEIGHPLFGATGSGTWAFDSPYFVFTVNP